jgi:hypothetical protein
MLHAFRASTALALLVVTHTTVLAAQDEARLRRVLEGKRLTVKIDMPATQEGVDVFPGSSRPIDFPKLSGRLKKYGVAIKDGESGMVTKVKVKDDLIEIQLGGGGYGTSGDVLSSLLTNQGADSGAAQQAQIANERTARLGAGSRFNLRYPNGVSADDLTPEAVVKALGEYAAFSGLAVAPEPSPQAGAPAAARAAGASEVRKGLSAEEVQKLLGVPVSSATNGQVTTSVYRAASGSGTVEVDYFNGVAVEVRQRPAAASTGVRKGMSLDEVEHIAGKPFDTKSNGPVTTHKYRWQDGVLEADFVNGVLVGYRIVSN